LRAGRKFKWGLRGCASAVAQQHAMASVATMVVDPRSVARDLMPSSTRKVIGTRFSRVGAAPDRLPGSP
jgi:hypothetical protein